MSSFRSKMIIGWREWCSLPDLGLPGIVAKIDTGAKTSSLHAFDITCFSREGVDWARFIVHPVQRHRQPEVTCEAQVVDERPVVSSNGKAENRLVVETTMKLGMYCFTTELTLTNRDEMGYRMLIGRQSLKHHCVVDPGLSYTLGEYEVANLYPSNLGENI